MAKPWMSHPLGGNGFIRTMGQRTGTDALGVANPYTQPCPVCKARRYERCFDLRRDEHGEYPIYLDEVHSRRPATTTKRNADGEVAEDADHLS